MMKTKPVATTLLVVMAIIFLISYPPTARYVLGIYHARIWGRYDRWLGGLVCGNGTLYEAFGYSF